MNALFFEKQSANLAGEPVRYRYILATFIVYVPLTLRAFQWSVRDGAFPMRPGTVIFLVLLGVFGWTLLEYLLHRFVHLGREGTLMGNAAAKLHMTHHRRPTYAPKVTTPVWVSLPIAVAVLGLLRLVSGIWEASLLVMAGILIGYLFYEVVHFRIHYGPQPGGVIEHQRATHTIHHRDRGRCFGVTTPLWDWVFGTSGPSV
jgi:sterol desaturase/sphingolipid hydroxylase (fatty acid hydroxylase superfamily)